MAGRRGPSAFPSSQGLHRPRTVQRVVFFFFSLYWPRLARAPLSAPRGGAIGRSAAADACTPRRASRRSFVCPLDPCLALAVRRAASEGLGGGRNLDRAPAPWGEAARALSRGAASGRGDGGGGGGSPGWRWIRGKRGLGVNPGTSEYADRMLRFSALKGMTHCAGPRLLREVDGVVPPQPP